MTPDRLKQLQEKSKNNEATINDVIEIVSESFLSQTKRMKELNNSLNSLISSINQVVETLGILELEISNSKRPMYEQVILKDYEEEEEKEYDHSVKQNFVEPKNPPDPPTKVKG